MEKRKREGGQRSEEKTEGCGFGRFFVHNSMGNSQPTKKTPQSQSQSQISFGYSFSFSFFLLLCFSNGCFFLSLSDPSLHERRLKKLLGEYLVTDVLSIVLSYATGM
jgi:hypothetical protein